jgi:predicted Zn-dependent protease
MAHDLIPAFAGRCSAGRRRGRTAHFGLSAAVLAVCLCLSACSSFNPARPGGEATVEEPGAGTTSISGTASAPPAHAGNSAIIALVHESDSDLAAGKKELAAAALERALRLTPADAALWHRLARIRQEQGRWRQSIELAQKSNSLAAGDRILQAGNWLLIARAQSILGNGAAAEAARRQAAALRDQRPPR